MPESIATLSEVGRSARHNPLTRFFRRAMIGALEEISWGSITVRDGDWEGRAGNPSGAGPAVTVEVRNPWAWAYLALGADIGAGQGYFTGMWDTPDLRTLLRILARNQSAMRRLERDWTAVSFPLYRLLHRLRSNTRRGSQRNIAAHYDLSNEFFRTFLDDRMLYSSAVYPAPGASLEEAQHEKIDRICRNLDLRPGEELLEIGSGWGGFAIHAAAKYGARVTTITLSREQHDHATEAVRAARMDHLVSVRLCDYRDLEGENRYDSVVSIEMIEAVGPGHMGTYFQTIGRLLRPGGRAAIQGITFPDQEFDRYLKSSDFIRHFIFPGGSLISLRQVLDHTANHTGLQMTGLEDIGLDYARTLHDWQRRLRRNEHALPDRFRDPAFLRLWNFYLASCEALFLERAASAVQMFFRNGK